jgi:hypothetical protein
MSGANGTYVKSGNSMSKISADSLEQDVGDLGGVEGAEEAGDVGKGGVDRSKDVVYSTEITPTTNATSAAGETFTFMSGANGTYVKSTYAEAAACGFDIGLARTLSMRWTTPFL